MVRLAAGVEENGRIEQGGGAPGACLPPAVSASASAMHARSVRVVGTNALRVARRKQAFLERARERARAIPSKSFRAWRRRASSTRASRTPCRAKRAGGVIVIGGGSTELIIGEGLTPLELESLQMGCGALSERILPRRQDHREAARSRARGRAPRARTGAGGIPPARLDERGGSSGTVRAIGEAIRSSIRHRRSITRDGLKRVLDYMVRQGSTRELSLAAITDERRRGVPGRHGDSHRSVRRATASSRWIARRRDARRPALRHRRPLHRRGCSRAGDMRSKRYHVDLAQAERRRSDRRELVSQPRDGLEARRSARRPDPRSGPSRLHEIGLDVSHNGYHRHGAYPARNADMQGLPERGAADARAARRRASAQGLARADG